MNNLECKPTRQPVMAEVCEQLTKTIEGLEVELATLTSRLEPVRIAKPQKDLAERKPASSYPSLIDNIFQARLRLDRLIDATRTLISELEI